MIELGKTQKLVILRKTSIGLYLNESIQSDDNDILLPQKQIPNQFEIGDEIEVFVYKDSEDRMISTTNKPYIQVDEYANLEVIETTSIGAFLYWGLEKDLFLPFSEQRKKVRKGDMVFVTLYIDNSNRLCATTKIYDLLTTDNEYEVEQWVDGIVYGINEEIGVFVAIEDKYHGMIPVNEVNREYIIGERAKLRIKEKRPDGKIILSSRKAAHNEINNDALVVLEKLERNKGFLQFNDKTSPVVIKKNFNMSKSSFKRAIGRLKKQNKIEISEKGISIKKQ